MRVRDAVAAYIKHQEERGLVKSTLSLTRLALAALLEPAMDEEVATLTSERMAGLGKLLRKRPSKRDGALLAERTIGSYLSIGCTFHGWALRAGYLKSGAVSAAEDRVRLGLLIQRLRQQAGMTRRIFARNAGLASAEVRRLEAGRYVLTAARWQRLTELLPVLAAQVPVQGIRVELVDSSPYEKKK